MERGRHRQLPALPDFTKTACDGAHTSLPVPLTKIRPGHIWRQEADMTQKPDSLAFRFGVVLAVAAIVLAIITWAAPPNSESAAAEPIPPREVIYRPQHLNLY
jgi:hypothetical protein